MQKLERTLEIRSFCSQGSSPREKSDRSKTTEPLVHNQGLASALLASVSWPGPWHHSFSSPVGFSRSADWDHSPGQGESWLCPSRDWRSAGGPQEAAAFEGPPFEWWTNLFSTFQEVKENGANYLSRILEPSFSHSILWSPMVYELLVKLMFACLECQRNRHYRPIRDKNQTDQSCPFKN